MAKDVGYLTILITWTPPFPAPLGYQIMVPTAGITQATNDTMYRRTVSHGLHTIEVRAHSVHYFSEVVLTSVTVRGEWRV